MEGPSWSSTYGSWIYNYICNHCLSPLKLQVWIPFRRGVLDTALYDKVYECKTDSHNITEILLKVALNTINQTKQSIFSNWPETHVLLYDHDNESLNLLYFCILLFFFIVCERCVCVITCAIKTGSSTSLSMGVPVRSKVSERTRTYMWDMSAPS